MMRWLPPLAAVAVLGLITLSFLGGREEADEARDAVADKATETTAEAPAELSDRVEAERLVTELGGVFDATATTLAKVGDEASARAALPALKDANTRLGELKGAIGQLPAASRTPIASAVSSGLERLRPLADKVLGTPAVGPVVEPVLKPMLETLQGFAG